MFTHILLTSDGSDNALRAARAAAEIAQKFNASLTLLTVFNPQVAAPISDMEPLMDTDTLSNYVDKVQDSVEQRTGQVLAELSVPYTTRREIGHPVDVIVNIAARDKYDLIVMGSRGLSTMESFLLGSVSDRVLNHAHCPVLIVK